MHSLSDQFSFCTSEYVKQCYSITKQWNEMAGGLHWWQVPVYRCTLLQDCHTTEQSKQQIQQTNPGDLYVHYIHAILKLIRYTDVGPVQYLSKHLRSMFKVSSTEYCCFSAATHSENNSISNISTLLTESISISMSNFLFASIMC